MQALRRRGQSLPLKPLDSEPCFIDDLTGTASIAIGKLDQYPKVR
jgi:hypothetical protein